MEITYNLIIKTLSNNHLKLNEEFVKKINAVQTFDDFPSKFKHLLNNNMYRKSVINYDNDNNISFWSSLVLLLKLPYNISTIIDFKNQISTKNSDLQSIANFLDVNFIIFDFQNVDISLVYKEECMNPFKQTFIFAKYKDLWSVIITDEKYLFDINTNEIKNILTSNCKYYNEINKIIKIEYDIMNIINMEKEKYIQQSNDNIFIKSEATLEKQSFSNNEPIQTKVEKLNKKIQSYEPLQALPIKLNQKTLSFDEPTNTNTNIDTTKLTSMKVAELTQLCDQLKISYKKKNIKKELIELILNNVTSESKTTLEQIKPVNNITINQNLDAQTKSELMNICDKLKLHYKKSAKKGELIKTILDNQI
jgi:hypothetical protein